MLAYFRDMKMTIDSFIFEDHQGIYHQLYHNNREEIDFSMCYPIEAGEMTPQQIALLDVQEYGSL